MVSDINSKDSNDIYLNGQSSLSSSMSENDPLLGTGHQIKSKRIASPWHVIVPLFFITFGMSALLAPMVQFYTEIFCQRYYQSSENANDALLTWMVGDTGMSNSPLVHTNDCAIPEIQAIVSRVQIILIVLDSASSLFMASFYGSLSDRHGRCLLLRIFSIGGIVVMFCYIAVANFQGVVGVTLLIVAPLARGLLAGDVIAVAAIQSYISDCTTPEARTVAMGRMIASILLGVIFGPTVASVLILKTGTVTYVFYMVLLIYVGFYFYATYYMPESLTQQAMETAQQKATQRQKRSFWQKINLFSALSVLVQAKPAHISRYAVPILAAIQFLMTTLGQPPILLYAMLEFKWTAYEGGLLTSIMALTRFVIIIWVLPSLLRTIQARWQHQKIGLVDDGDDNKKEYRRVLCDITMIRTGLGIDTLCIILSALTASGPAFTLSMVFQSMSIIAQPSIRSLYTSLVDPSEVGALCGAQAVLDSIATMVTMTGINFIYSISVVVMPSLFLYVCAGVAGLGFVLSLLIHPVKSQNDQSTP
ncbi:major facilitator superfamily domain-containing protein [Absidia repens]|uniref:Major facilitator superfamily domain-containing protein n=1 Tax=Absidia repens TaxID=90262 RepID=A0A1X2IBW9_9FUNG|nr:major facilitator superfamily domain-containing protein [Absidia repens]